MEGKYPFPDDIRNPDRKEPNPFAAEDPHLEQPLSAEEAPTYGVSAQATEYRPVYQAVLPDRAFMCSLIGWVGLLLSVSGWLAFFDIWYFAGLALMPLFSLAGSLPALLISISDLRAMNRGAMKDDRKGLASVACFVGALGVTNSIAYLAIGVWRIWMAM